MNVEFTPEMEQYLLIRVQSGDFASTTDVVREALRRMRDADASLDALRAAVAEGDAQLDRGEGLTYGPALLEEITERALARAGTGRQTSADVRP